MSSEKTKEFYIKTRDARYSVPKDSLWKHYKGGVYKITGHSISTIDTEVMIIYHRVAGLEYNAYAEEGINFCRPFSEWFDSVDAPYGDSQPLQRFVHVKETNQTVYVETPVAACPFRTDA